jgi:hypothetical protein
MRIRHRSCRAAGVAVLALATLVCAAQTADVFDFIPLGGRTLLARAFAGRAAEDIKTVVAGKHTRDEWVAELKRRGPQFPAVQRLSDKELLTLADYMSFTLPLPPAKVPANPARAAWDKLLPMDGRDMSLEYCQGCHIITVVITQDRTKQAWLGSMNKPSHVQIKLNAQQREALANYLVLNAAIPIEQVPEDLRAGGATY